MHGTYTTERERLEKQQQRKASRKQPMTSETLRYLVKADTRELDKLNREDASS